MGHRYFSITNTDSTNLDIQLLSLSLSKDEEDWASIYHSHHFTEIFFIVEGEGKFLFRDEIFSNIAAGDLVIIPPHTEHTEESISGHSLKYYVLAIGGIALKSEKDPKSAPIVCNFRSNQFIAILFEQMHYEMRNHSYGTDTLCQKIFEVLLFKIIRSQHLRAVPSTAAKIPKECAKIKDYLDTHYAEHITLDTLTELTHLNKYYISHSFVKYTGLSPIQYLNELRLETACRLLKESDFSIVDISSFTGFSSQSYFSQTFHKKYGLTPIKYRQEERKKTEQ